MQLFNYIEINIFAFAILLIIFLNIRNSSEKSLFDQKLFMALICSNALILLFDTGMWFLNNNTGFLAREANIFITTVYYILNPIPCMLWSLYADFQISRDERRFSKLFVPLLIPVGINTILAIISPFNHFMFYIDKNNVYHRGKLFLVMALICLLYLVYTFVQIAKQKSVINKKEYFSLISFAFPPFFGAVIQTMFYGISIIWICMSMSLLIVFINIQNKQLYTDYLTGLYNRRQLDNYLAQRIENGILENPLAGIMIDLNSFKKINDIYGHAMGDQALEHTANILKKSVSKDDFVARYGGDEFAIIIEVNENTDLIKTVNRIRENIYKFNAKKLTPYEISLSIGFDIFDFGSGIAIQQFLKHIDDLMYEDKKKKIENYSSLKNY